MRTLAAVFLGILTLAACESQPKPSNAPPPGISFRLNGTDIEATNRQAESYCQGYGKRAALDKVSPTGNDKVASYECR